MVLESLISPKRALGRPIEMMAIGFVYAIIAAFLALWIFKSYVSVIMITFTVIACIPFVHNVMKAEEAKGTEIKNEKKILKEHSKAIRALFYLFVGFVIAFSCLYIFMPSTIVEKMFSAQLETIITVQSNEVSGNFITATGIYLSPFATVGTIFLNNIKILVFCIAFAFFYGSGAIFILTWNASVMATAIGSFVRNNLFYAKSFFDYFQITAIGFLQYFFHGLPEIAAYFIGALASGMLSFALINHDFMDEKFKLVLKDSAILTGIAAAVLFAAALIEVFITPLIL